MASVRLSFSPNPAQVRTARMVGVALARRSGLPTEFADEVRLAVGEACSRAIEMHRAIGSTAPVCVHFIEDDRGFEVRVEDEGDTGRLGTSLGLAIIRGLVDIFDMGPRVGGGTVLVLRWRR